MALGVSDEIIGGDIKDGSLIDIPSRDVPLLDQLAQPRGRLGVDLVVVSGHSPQPPKKRCRQHSEKRPDKRGHECCGYDHHLHPCAMHSAGMYLLRS